MAIELTAEQRDAFYEQILERIEAVDDLPRLVKSDNLTGAQNFGSALADELHLICTDLGWGNAASEAIELKTPPDVLRRIFTRIGHAAASMSAAERVQADEMLELRQRNHILVEACLSGLAKLEAEGK